MIEKLKHQILSLLYPFEVECCHLVPIEQRETWTPAFGSSDFWPMQEWMSGQVWDVLPHGLRVHRLMENTRFTGEFYIVPSHAIPASLLKDLYLEGPKNMPSQRILVQFQAALEPCSNEAFGEGRASQLRLVREGGFDDRRRSCSQSVVTFPPPLPPCPAMRLAADEWQSMESEDCLQDCQDAAEGARDFEDGPLLCDILSSCIAGLQVILDSRAWAKHFHQVFGAGIAEVKKFQANLLQLLDSCLTCLLALDLSQMEVQKSLRVALRFCLQLSPHMTVPDFSPEVRERWQKILELAQLGLKTRTSRPKAKTPKTPKICMVEGCLRKCRRWILKPDVHGGVGWRCKKHSVKALCNVPGCGRFKVARVYHRDAYSLAGPRCCRHGARSCNVPGCSRYARFKECQDSLGAAGRRCTLHCSKSLCFVPGCQRIGTRTRKVEGSSASSQVVCEVHRGGCRVAGCRRISWGRVQGADELGPAGRACWLHGGKACNIPGCKSRPIHLLENGLGARCKRHSEVKQKRKARSTSQFDQSLELLDQDRCHFKNGDGWRCKHPKDMASKRYCEHHEAWYRRRLERMRQKRVSSSQRKSSIEGLPITEAACHEKAFESLVFACHFFSLQR